LSQTSIFDGVLGAGVSSESTDAFNSAAGFAQNVMGRDTAARYGSEEFAVILPNTELDSVTILANKVREAVASKRIRKKPTGEDFDAISISIGVAKSRNGELLSELTQRSDKGLYQAKDSRRRAKKSAES
jgi:diguanylate cyclase